MTDEQRRAGAIYVGLASTTTAYAVYLESLKKSYEPDHTYLTVVGGNAMLGLAFLALCLATPPRRPVHAFYHLVGVNVAGGAPIIAWQLWQREQRLRQELARRERNGHGR